jgi:uncharacterized membrane protein
MVNLYFRNNYPSSLSLWVAIMFWSPARCGHYGNFGTRGWWQVDRGQTKLVWGGNTGNRYYYYYAKAADGAQWTGNFGPVYVYHQAFDSCLRIGSSAAYATVKMREIDVDNYDNYTMTLHA